MIDTILLFFLQNILILTLIFWLLSYLGTKFFQERHFISSTEFFECGFFSTDSFNIKFNLNFLIIINLLILYDVEFLFIVPYFYNFQSTTLFSSFLFILFLLLVIIALVYDWEMVSLK